MALICEHFLCMANAVPGGPIALLGMHLWGHSQRPGWFLSLGEGGGSRLLGQPAVCKGLRPPTCQVALLGPKICTFPKSAATRGAAGCPGQAAVCKGLRPPTFQIALLGPKNCTFPKSAATPCPRLHFSEKCSWLGSKVKEPCDVQ